MWYLLIPLFIFVGLAILNSLLLPGLSRRQLTGKPQHLRLVASVLMSAKLEKRLLIVRPTRRVAEIEATFRERSARIKLPLTTKAQKKRRDELLLKVQAFDTSARLSEASDGQLRIYAYLHGDPTEVADALYALMASVFDLEENRSLQFDLESHSAELTIIQNEWERFYGKVEGDLPEAWTGEASDSAVKKANAGCMPYLFSLFIRPIPMIIAFYWFGIWGAIVAAAIVWALSVAYNWAYDRSSLIGMIATPRWLVIPILCLASFYSSSIYYFQLLPTLFCILVGMEAVRDSIVKRNDCTDQSSSTDQFMQKWLHVTMVGLMIVGVLISEYMRKYLSIEAWLWYYAYLRVELMLAAIPSTFALFLAMKAREERDDKSEVV